MSQGQFQSPAGQYDRFMGRYTAVLAPAMIIRTGVEAGWRVVDVGCGPGGLTSVLAERCGAGNVAAIDPAEQFVAACAQRLPGVDARVGLAEHLPWPDGTFDAALASLVVGFMKDPARGVAEMARVTRPGGSVAASMWALPGGMPMLDTFWQAFAEVHPGPSGDFGLPGTEEGDLETLLAGAGLVDVTSGALEATVTYTDFDDWWEPITFGVGPVGQALVSLDREADRDAVRLACRALLPASGTFSQTARAWFARGAVPGRP